MSPNTQSSRKSETKKYEMRKRTSANTPAYSAMQVPSKQRDSRSVASCDSELPHRITAVKQAINNQGAKRDLLVVHALDEQGAATHYLLPQTALFLGQFAELSRLVFAAQLIAYQSPKGLRELAQLLLQAVDGCAYVAEHDGYHLLTLEGARYEMLIWRTKVHVLGNRAPISVLVSPDIPALPPASCSLEDWNQQVGQYAVANPKMLVALCAAIASLLVRLYGLPRIVLAVGADSKLSHRAD